MNNHVKNSIFSRLYQSLPSTTQDRKLRIGLIVDSPQVSSYIYDLAEWGQRQPDLIISHLVVQVPSEKISAIGKLRSLRKQKGIAKLLDALASYLLRQVEIALFKAVFKLVGTYKKYQRHFGVTDLRNLGLEEIDVVPNISQSGFVYRFGRDAIAAIQRANIDILIRCGRGIHKGDVLTCTPFGVISIHDGDNRVNRGGPSGFWEIYYKENKTGFIIQQLTDELDGGNVLFRGAFPTKPFVFQNQANLHAKSHFYLKKLLLDISAIRKLPDPEPQKPFCYSLYRNPSCIQQLTYLAFIVWYAARRISNKLLNRQWRWGVAFVRNEWKASVLWRGIKIPNPPNRFLADPFVVFHDGHDYCFVEDYDFKKRKGDISVYRLHTERAEFIGKALEEKFHLSFPFVLTIAGKLYMIPKLQAAFSIRLYECISFPLAWKLKTILMNNVEACDTLMFEKDGLWWLLTNIDPLSLGETYSELFLFYSHDPFSDSWKPHPANPLCVDPDKARNGGILFDGKGEVYRVGQKHGFDMYGHAAQIYKITILNKRQYKEELYANIEPKFFHGIKGTHHFNAGAGVTVYDYVTLVTSP